MIKRENDDDHPRASYAEASDAEDAARAAPAGRHGLGGAAPARQPRLLDQRPGGLLPVSFRHLDRARAHPDGLWERGWIVQRQRRGHERLGADRYLSLIPLISARHRPALYQRRWGGARPEAARA